MNKLIKEFRNWIERKLIELINYFNSTIVNFCTEENKKLNKVKNYDNTLINNQLINSRCMAHRFRTPSTKYSSTISWSTAIVWFQAPTTNWNIILSSPTRATLNLNMTCIFLKNEYLTIKIYKYEQHLYTIWWHLRMILCKVNNTWSKERREENRAHSLVIIRCVQVINIRKSNIMA